MTRTMKALWGSASGFKLVQRLVPVPQPGEVLVRNAYVASNPKDYKVFKWLQGYENVEGSEVAGYVEAVGEGVTHFEKGDRVASFTKMRDNPRFGAYAEYSAAPSNTTFHVAPTTTLEDAVTVPLGCATAAIALFRNLRLASPFDASTVVNSPSPPTLIVNGAATTVGHFAVQLAGLVGVPTIGVAGSSVDFAYAAGCTSVVDYRQYRDPDSLGTALVRAAGEATDVRILDLISTPESIRLLCDVLQPFGGGRLSYVLHDLPADLPANVALSRTSVGTAHNDLRRGTPGQAPVDNSSFARDVFSQLGDWLERGLLTPHPVRLLPDGLRGVEAGLAMLERGEVSAEKLVYRVADT